MAPIKHLHDLQEIDLEVAAVEESRSQVRMSIADDSVLVSTREQLSQLNDRQEKFSVVRLSVERGIAELQDKLSRVESRLYGGEITNPREMSATEEERDFILSQKRKEEDDLLEIMLELEEGESRIDSTRDNVQKLEAERLVEISQLTERDAELTTELASLGNIRDEMTPHIMEDVLLLYESLRQSKGGQALVRVERGSCQGCRITLSTAQLQRARSAQEIVQCARCQRILYLV